MPLDIQTALQNCQIKEAKTPLFDLEKMKSFVGPTALMATGAAIVAFTPGMDSLFTSLAATATRVADNTSYIAEHQAHLLYAVGAIVGGIGAALTAVGVMENRDRKRGVENDQRVAASNAARDAWETISRTNDNLAEKVSEKYGWLRATIGEGSNETVKVLKSYGLNPHDRGEMADLQRAYLHGLKKAVVTAAAADTVPVFDGNLHDQFTQRAIAAGMVDYYKGRQAPLKLVENLNAATTREMATRDIPQIEGNVYDLARAGFEAIRVLGAIQRVEKEITADSVSIVRTL